MTQPDSSQLLECKTVLIVDWVFQRIMGFRTCLCNVYQCCFKLVVFVSGNILCGQYRGKNLDVGTRSGHNAKL